MGQLTRGQTIGLVALLAIVTGWVGITALHTGPPAVPPGIVVHEAPPATNPNPAGFPTTTSTPGNSASLSSTASGTAGTEIVVHVAGAVKKPGVYHLQPGSRNDDAVKAAGGLTSVANPDAINLAAHTEDGSQLYVPTRSERPSGGANSPDASTVSSVPTGGSSGGTSPARGAKGGGQSGHASTKLSNPSQGQININTADATQLQRIPGIGPAMAERILAYRHTAGRFQSTDEMLQISGIGDKKYQKMKPFMNVR